MRFFLKLKLTFIFTSHTFHCREIIFSRYVTHLALPLQL